MEQHSQTNVAVLEELLRKTLLAVAGSALCFIGPMEFSNARYVAGSADIALAVCYFAYVGSESATGEMGSMILVSIAFLAKALIDSTNDPIAVAVDLAGIAASFGYVASSLAKLEKRKRG